MPRNYDFLSALKTFADQVAEKFTGVIQGEPENQLRGPIDTLIAGYANSQQTEGRVVLVGETQLEGRIGRPDFSLQAGTLPFGHLELKAPGKGARTERYRGHDRTQWNRFADLPNILYTDGNEWALYRDGQRIGELVKLSSDLVEEGADAISEDDARNLSSLLDRFLVWTPEIPQQASRLAQVLAPRCRMMRAEVLEAMQTETSNLRRLAVEWRELLFPDADDHRFADAYAQTVTFALLLARAEGVSTRDLSDASDALQSKFSLMSRALEVLTDQQARREIRTSLEVLQRVIDAVDPEAMGQGEDEPWLYFYEDFLATYDPDLRRNYGVYYTPAEVVRCQVRLLDELLTQRLDRPLGFAESSVVTLDPAVGTGTYPLGVIKQAMERVRQQEGDGAVAGRAATLATNLHGFEWMVGPYSVAELRLSQEFERFIGSTPEDGVNVYLTNALESPYSTPPNVTLFNEPIAIEHRRALQVKRRTEVLVCLGNPPYDRHTGVGENTDAGSTGGWVRHGEGDGDVPILEDFLRPARDAGYGVHLKNLYNLYVYFWRWAFWKVFEFETARGPGLVSFITAASYLNGNAFVGMREHMRRNCDEIWIIDLGGEGRGTRREENVFAIQTPVCIAICARYAEPNDEKPATVHYYRVPEETREGKLRWLDGVTSIASVEWSTCPDEWHAPFVPAGVGDYFAFPQLTDLFPWQHSGCQVKRTWPIAADESTLRRRWQKLLESNDRASLFKETRDRKVARQYRATSCIPSGPPLAEIANDEPCPRAVPYGYRSFDRQKLLLDNRVGDYLREVLWQSQSPNQVFLTTLLNHRLGEGPALTVSAYVPDLHHFRGSYGAKEVIPLQRAAGTANPNIAPGLLELLRSHLTCEVTAEDVTAYVYALLAHPGYTRRFWSELETREVRVPLTADPSLFGAAKSFGGRLIWLHTFGERFRDHADVDGLPHGSVRCTAAVPNDVAHYPESFKYDAATSTLHVGSGAFSPVPSTVWEYDVSGLRVVSSWLDNRMASPGGRRSSALDEILPQRWLPDFTTELLRVLAILEATIEGYPRQQQLLDQILTGPLINADELPPVPEEVRDAPTTMQSTQRDLF